jgi:predicted AlkP superfamily phosphohydrolase/phosphomutase
MKEFDKLIVLGIDGLDPRILTMLREQGAVPNFDRLWREGVAGPLQTVAPAQSPVVWTTIASGANPGKHGVFDFIHREPNQDPKRPLPFLSICRTSSGAVRGGRYVKPRQARAFWDVLTENGIPVTAVRWPVTFPAEAVNGRMLSGLGVPGIRGTLGHYTCYTDAPESLPDVPADRLMKVQVMDGTVQTVIKGPMVRGLRGTAPAELPMTVRVGSGSAVVTVSGTSVELTPGRWGDWVALRFSLGALKKVAGMVKFLLVEAAPRFRLYMSAIEPDPTDPAFVIASPGGYAGELAQAIGTYHTLGMPEDTKALDEGVIDGRAFVEQCADVTQDRLRMFWHEFGRFTGGVFAFVFDTSDRIQHMFWRQNRMQDRVRVAELGESIRDHYVQMDGFLGELLGAMDGGTALVTVSDHGFASYDVNFDLNAWLVEEGLMTLTQDPADVPEEDTGLYRLVDWSQTVAYGCGFSSLYFNLRGRENNGGVLPSEADGIAARIAERMPAYTDPSTGLNPVVRVDRARDLYSGAALPDGPDMVVSTRPGYRIGWHTAVGGVCATVLSPNEKHWSGDHIVDPAAVSGTIMSNAPLNVAQASVLDIAPSALAILGVPIPEEMDGTSLLDRGA